MAEPAIRMVGGQPPDEVEPEARPPAMPPPPPQELEKQVGGEAVEGDAHRLSEQPSAQILNLLRGNHPQLDERGRIVPLVIEDARGARGAAAGTQCSLSQEGRGTG